MGGSSVPLPAPVVVQSPTEDDIKGKKEKEAADAARGAKSAAASRTKKTNVTSQSRNTGFSGSGIFIPGRS